VHASDVRENGVERARHLGEVEGVDEEAGVLDLPATADAEEAAELGFGAEPAPGGLVLQGAERAQIALGVHNLFDAGGAEGTDQLVLEIGVADVEAAAFHVGAGQRGVVGERGAGPLEGAAEVVLLRSVAEAREPEVQPLGAVRCEGVSDPLGAADRDDGNALGGETASPALGEGFEGVLVAGAFDEDDGARGGHWERIAVRGETVRRGGAARGGSGHAPS
jgi:hypothetical protein